MEILERKQVKCTKIVKKITGKALRGSSERAATGSYTVAYGVKIVSQKFAESM